MEDDLEQEIAELVLEIVHVAARDRLGDLVGLFDGVGRDRGEVLLDIPGAPVSGSRSRAMISISRPICLPGIIAHSSPKAARLACRPGAGGRRRRAFEDLGTPSAWNFAPRRYTIAQEKFPTAPLLHPRAGVSDRTL